MKTNKQNYDQYQKAYKKVQNIKGFYTHLTSFVLVIGVVIFINLKYSPEHLWFFYPLLGWGIGVVAHAIGVFEILPYFGKDWEQRKIEQFMENEKNNNNIKNNNMEDNTNEDKRYQEAIKHVKKIKGFYTHLAVYVVINCMIIIVNFQNLDLGESYFQFSNFTTAFFWGLGLLAHGLSTFVPSWFLGNNWEEKKIKELMDKDKKTNWE